MMHEREKSGLPKVAGKPTNTSVGLQVRALWRGDVLLDVAQYTHRRPSY